MSVTPQQMLERVLAGQSLDEPTSIALLQLMATGELPPALAGALLVALLESRDLFMLSGIRPVSANSVSE